MWEGLNYSRLYFHCLLYPYSYSLPDGATRTSIKMPKRLGKIKPPILGWETQLAKETTTSLFNETHWNSLLSRATQRDDLLNQTPSQNNTNMSISITSLTWLCCWDIFSMDIFDHAKMRQWFRGQVFFTLVNSSIFRDNKLKLITVVCQYFMVRKINHTVF